MMQSCEVRVATHVKAKGLIEKIASKWGIDDGGRFSKPSMGGFGVITESGRKVSMWEAEAYFLLEDKPDDVIWPLVLTRSQQMALTTFLAEYMRQPDAIEVSVDVLTDTETTPADLLELVMAIQPKKRGDTL
jgi:hypothetical protein